ncbi:hypothetical protein ONZ45_g11466 [Pleurotus djamor]|nr:hypothetical protein ONZ45_g11466 [Pleurotus djamor]
MKATRATLDKSVGLPAEYDAFFSFPVNKGGYSGVAVYTRKDVVVPSGAEEGLSGTLPLPKNITYPLDPKFHVSDTYPRASSMFLLPECRDGADQSPETPALLTHLDLEGRSLTIDFGLFVLINLYCPNETSDVRLPFKMNFHLLLEERVKHLVHGEKREVIVVGDMNICAAPEDHCEGHLQTGTLEDDSAYMQTFVPDERKGQGFWRHPAREWFRRWIDNEDGMLVDVLRRQWPDRKGMYTCPKNKGQSSSRVVDYPENSFKVESSRDTISKDSHSGKRKLTVHNSQNNTNFEKSKKKKTLVKPSAGQAKLSSFFLQSQSQGEREPSKAISRSDASPADGEAAEVDIVDVDVDFDIQEQIEADYHKSPSGSVKAAWNSIMIPIQPPKCKVHAEPTTEYTVNKLGPNKGKKFFICSRPVGPGYDKGRGERAREDVDPQWRCNYFKWSSEVRKEMDMK